MAERQLSGLDPQHLFEPPPDYLIARQPVGAFGGGVHVFVDERAIFPRAEQCQPVRRIIEVGLQARLARGELSRPFLDPLLEHFVRLLQRFLGPSAFLDTFDDTKCVEYPALLVAHRADVDAHPDGVTGSP